MTPPTAVSVAWSVPRVVPRCLVVVVVFCSFLCCCFPCCFYLFVIPSVIHLVINVAVPLLCLHTHTHWTHWAVSVTYARYWALLQLQDDRDSKPFKVELLRGGKKESQRKTSFYREGEIVSVADPTSALGTCTYTVHGPKYVPQVRPCLCGVSMWALPVGCVVGVMLICTCDAVRDRARRCIVFGVAAAAAVGTAVPVVAVTFTIVTPRLNPMPRALRRGD